MNDDRRPDPEALLAAARKEDSRRGRLHIFLGMSPGVGKTYAMLLAARRAAAEGKRVLIGVVETHGREETAALLEGLEVLPRKRTEHRGTFVEEFDLDAALARRPDLLLVDELAHTNAPGSRHPKRYHDVLELVAAGINVHTTLNVQHLESRADVVAQITRATQRETVPDSLLDEADEVELVDVTPAQLRQRLAEGKVYLGERAEAAALNFFKEENLTALREMALRTTAERVDRELREQMRAQNISGPWKSSERLMVAIGPSPFSESLVRWTRRAAAARDCPWVAVHVEPGAPLDDDARQRLSRQLALARQLGAEVISVSGDSVADALLRAARERNVTQIVVGKPLVKRWWHWLRGGSLLDALLRDSGDIEVCAVRPMAISPAAGGSPPKAVAADTLENASPAEWWQAGAIIALTTALGLLVEGSAGYRSVALLYLLAVVIAAFRLGRWPVFAVAVAGALAWDFLFIPPRFTVNIGEVHDAMMCGMLLVVAIALGHFATRLRRREIAERERERRTAALLELTNKTALAPELDSGLAAALRQIEGLFRVRTVLYLRQDDTHHLRDEPHPASAHAPDPKEFSVAVWAFEKRQPAGRFTETLPDVTMLWLPLQARTAVMGALGVLASSDQTLTLGERDWLQNFSVQIASVLEKEHFMRAFQAAEVSEASERLRRTLLDSVSHELKTPLAALQAAADGMERDPARAGGYLIELRSAMRRLHRTVNNLLDMTRLESGAVKPVVEWCDINELCDGALELVGDALQFHHFMRDVPANLPMVRIDQALIEQALANLLLNAAMHTPPKTEVMLTARLDHKILTLSVLDRGAGLPDGDANRIFQKFTRGERAPAGGSGLGLAIARGFARAHGGNAIARRREGGGAEFSLTMPVEILDPSA
jgi:two-component system, OmpR family, sensor histidine kinase KdpD